MMTFSKSKHVGFVTKVTSLCVVIDGNSYMNHIFYNGKHSNVKRFNINTNIPNINTLYQLTSLLLNAVNH